MTFFAPQFTDDFDTLDAWTLRPGSDSDYVLRVHAADYATGRVSVVTDCAYDVVQETQVNSGQTRAQTPTLSQINALGFTVEITGLGLECNGLDSLVLQVDSSAAEAFAYRYAVYINGTYLTYDTVHPWRFWGLDRDALGSTILWGWSAADRPTPGSPGHFFSRPAVIPQRIAWIDYGGPQFLDPSDVLGIKVWRCSNDGGTRLRVGDILFNGRFQGTPPEIVAGEGIDGGNAVRITSQSAVAPVSGAHKPGEALITQEVEDVDYRTHYVRYHIKTDVESVDGSDVQISTGGIQLKLPEISDYVREGYEYDGAGVGGWIYACPEYSYYKAPATDSSHGVTDSGATWCEAMQFAHGSSYDSDGIPLSKTSWALGPIRPITPDNRYTVVVRCRGTASPTAGTVSTPGPPPASVIDLASDYWTNCSWFCLDDGVFCTCGGCPCECHPMSLHDTGLFYPRMCMVHTICIKGPGVDCNTEGAKVFPCLPPIRNCADTLGVLGAGYMTFNSMNFCWETHLDGSERVFTYARTTIDEGYATPDPNFGVIRNPGTGGISYVGSAYDYGFRPYTFAPTHGDPWSFDLEFMAPAGDVFYTKVSEGVDIGAGDFTHQGTNGSMVADGTWQRYRRTRDNWFGSSGNYYNFHIGLLSGHDQDQVRIRNLSVFEGPLPAPPPGSLGPEPQNHIRLRRAVDPVSGVQYNDTDFEAIHHEIIEGREWQEITFSNVVLNEDWENLDRLDMLTVEGWVESGATGLGPEIDWVKVYHEGWTGQELFWVGKYADNGYPWDVGSAPAHELVRNEWNCIEIAVLVNPDQTHIEQQVWVNNDSNEYAVASEFEFDGEQQGVKGVAIGEDGFGGNGSYLLDQVAYGYKDNPEFTEGGTLDERLGCNVIPPNEIALDKVRFRAHRVPQRSFGDATETGDSPDVATNDNYADAIALLPVAGDELDGTTYAASNEESEPAEVGTNSVWYTWESPIDGPVEFTIEGDYGIGVFTGSDLASLVYVYAGNPASFIAEQGVTYSIAVWTTGDPGPFTLAWSGGSGMSGPCNQSVNNYDYHGLLLSGHPRPPGEWRPFSDTSPLNTPASGSLYNDGTRTSASIISYLASNRSNEISARALNWGGTADDYDHTMYFAKVSDALVTVHNREDNSNGGSYGSAETEGQQYRVPLAAKPAGTFSGNTPDNDGHFTVVQPDGSVLTCWKAELGFTDGGTLWCRWSAVENSIVNGNGLTRSDKAGSTAARFVADYGAIRLEDLASECIGHALFGVTYRTRGFVSPASGTGSETADTHAPPMGALLRYTKDEGYISAQGWPGWLMTIARAMRDYGVIIGDTGGGSSNALFLILESDVVYRSFTSDYSSPYPNEVWAASQGIPSYVSGGRTMYKLGFDDYASTLKIEDFEVLAPS